MKPQYAITRATPGDVPALAAIERTASQLLRGHAPQSVLDEVTDGETFRDAQARGRLWVALADDAPVGFALVEMLSADAPHLDEIDVRPRHGRRGLGTALVRAVCDWAARAGHRRLTLTTFRRVPWNMPFYLRLGFEEIPATEMTPELLAVVRDETSRGLDPGARAVLRWRTR